MTNLYTFNQLKACIGSVKIIKYNEITINTCTKKCMQFYYHSALIILVIQNKKKINSQLIFKLWKISNYENYKKNVNKFGLPLCVIRKVKSHKWQGNNLQQA